MALLCRWCEELVVFLGAHAVLLWWFSILWGSSASVCDCGLTRGSTFHLDPIRLLLCLAKKCLGLMMFLSEFHRFRGQVLCQTIGTKAKVGLESEWKSFF